MARKNGPVTVCVINLKGGVGKSTISALLARRAFAHYDLDVLAVDLDPQANLSQALMHESYQGFLDKGLPSIVELFKGYQPPLGKRTSTNELSTNNVVQTIGRYEDHSLQILPSRFDFSDNLISAVKPDEHVLARFLSTNFQEKDFVIIDCAPTESILTRAAYHASGSVLVPVKPEYFATIGYPLLQESLRSFRAPNSGHKIDVCGVVINNAFYDGGNDGGPEKERALREIRDESRKNGWQIYRNQIPHSRGFPKLMRGDYSYQGNARLFERFAAEFFASVGLVEA
jgi:chromosome partitioning protein